MLSYLAQRLLESFFVLAIMSLVIYLLIGLMPGDPIDIMIFSDPEMTPAEAERLRAIYGLDQPILDRYLAWLGNALSGDFGYSRLYNQPTLDILLPRLGNTVILMGLSFILALVIALPAGIYAATRPQSPVDHAINMLAFAGISVPPFWLAILLIILFAVTLGWLPAGGWNGGSLESMLLPVITLALPQVAVIARLMRGSMIEALRSDHVRTARAYGLPVRMIVITHSLRAASLPAISYLGPAAAALLTGSVVVETIFGLPGIGRYFVQGALNRDYTLVMGTVIIVALFVIVFNLIVDLLYAALDPRVRYD